MRTVVLLLLLIAGTAAALSRRRFVVRPQIHYRRGGRFQALEGATFVWLMRSR